MLLGGCQRRAQFNFVLFVVCLVIQLTLVEWHLLKLIRGQIIYFRLVCARLLVVPVRPRVFLVHSRRVGHYLYKQSYQTLNLKIILQFVISCGLVLKELA